jgi:SAM-dependent methyltransferase
MAVRPYRWTAEYYDLLFSLVRRPARLARRRILGSLLPHVETACDIACGTGTTALELAGRGIEMFAVDLSPTMCRLSREKARLAGLPLRVLHADMREFRLPRQVDLVLCEFDALNHVPRKVDLAKVVTAVGQALKPGGHFYFDVNNRLAFETYWRSTVWIEKPGVVMAMRNGSDPKRYRAWCDIEWFVREGDGWKRHRERVEEVCWTSREIRSALREAGFDRVRAWDAAPFFNDSITTPGCRTFYLARKRPRPAAVL